jgi:hypothetical protein
MYWSTKYGVDVGEDKGHARMSRITCTAKFPHTKEVE